MSADPAKPSKAKRQADMALVASYHEARLADLLERVRDGFERYDSGELDAFELDELIHRYKKAARELWKFCAEMTGGRSAGFIARTLEEMQARGETIDWWGARQPRASPSLTAGLHARRTRFGHIRQATRDHCRPPPSSSKKLICCESLASDDPACPAVPCSEVMKEILGKLMGL